MAEVSGRGCCERTLRWSTVVGEGMAAGRTVAPTLGPGRSGNLQPRCTYPWNFRELYRRGCSPTFESRGPPNFYSE